MDQVSKAAYITAMAACAQIEATAMSEANKSARAAGQPAPHMASDFENLIVKYGIHHNAVIGYLP